MSAASAPVPHRPLFWGIESSWLFYLLAAIAMTVCLTGVYRHARTWWRARDSSKHRLPGGALRRLVVDGFLGRRLFSGELAAGLMHALIFWGFLGLFVATVLVAIHDYLIAFLTGDTYLVFSLGADIAGVLLIIGLLWATIRRYVQRVPRLLNRGHDLLLLLWLFGVALSGFAVEGLRLAAQKPAWAAWSPFGALASAVVDGEGSTTAYVALWWIHAVASLALVATLPFTKLFHAVAAPTALALGPDTDDTAPDVSALGARWPVMLDACTACGRCVDACPAWAAREPFEPRDLVEAAGSQNKPSWFWPGAVDGSRANSWHCTTCRACFEVCPVGIDAHLVALAARRETVEQGTDVPPLLAQSLERLFKYGNPWEASKKRRTRFLKELDKASGGATPGQDGALCYFVGCTTGIDTRAQGLGRALADVLAAAGVAWGTLGKREPCCGDIARRVGEAGLFEEQSEKLAGLLGSKGVDEVVTSSPHCYHTLRNAYEWTGNGDDGDVAPRPRVRHYSELLDALISSGALKLAGRVDATVTYHDPCYLARYNRVVDAPRRVLRAIPGVELVEMPRSGTHAFCCGGGGGRMWQEDIEGEQKIAELRVAEAAATGATKLITACPLCLIMLDDANKTAGLQDSLEVVDLNQLVASALEKEEEGGSSERETTQ